MQTAMYTLIADPCKDFKCPSGSTCEVFQPTGEAFCQPSCDLDNGGCASNETCLLEEVQCVRAPCPPVVKCLPSEWLVLLCDITSPPKQNVVPLRVRCSQHVVQHVLLHAVSLDRWSVLPSV